jgi:heat shock protein HtpX
VRGHALRAAAPAGPAFAVIVLAAAGAGIGAAAAGAVIGVLVGVLVAVALGAAAWAYCDRMALSAAAARPVSEVEHPDLYRLVRELSKDGRLPVPRLYLSPAEQPNSFVVGRGPRGAAICCTEGLLRILDEAELRGVLGHELAHASGRDILAASVSAGLARIITFPAGLGRLLPGRAAEAPLMLVFGPIAALVIRLTVTQSREYRADAAGALLTGDPVALASALRKIDFRAAQLPLPPDGRLTSVGHLMIVSPFRADGIARLFATHPPTAERVRRLEALAGYRRYL